MSDEVELAGDVPEFESEAEKAEFLFQSFSALANGLKADSGTVGVVAVHILVVMLHNTAENFEDAMKGLEAATKDMTKGLKLMYEVTDQ